MVPMRSFSSASRTVYSSRPTGGVVLAPEPRSANGTAPARARKVRRESEDDMAGRYHNGSAGRYIEPRHVAGRSGTCAELISCRGNTPGRAGLCRSAGLLFDEWV